MTAAIIQASQKVTPFMFQGGEVVAVSAQYSIFSGKCSFQICGTAWASPAYQAEALIAAGADASELAAMADAAKAAVLQ